MKKFNQKRFSLEALYLAILTTVTVMAWIGFEVFRSLTTAKDIPFVTTAEITPLKEGIEIEAINLLSGRFFPSQEALEAVTAATESVTIKIEPDREASSSDEI